MFTDWWSQKTIVGVSVFGAAVYVTVYTLNCAKEPGDFEPVPLAAQVTGTITGGGATGAWVAAYAPNMAGDAPIKLVAYSDTERQTGPKGPARASPTTAGFVPTGAGPPGPK
jgi:hypothetical protein